MKYNQKDLNRFWEKVDTTGECWLWTSQTRSGYGLFRLNGKIVSAHRLSYLIHNGHLPNIHVCHSCDTPACVKPEHLFLGTAKINSDDKMVKDRHNFTLSNEQVVDIRSRPVTITMCRDLANEFSCSPALIKRVLTGESYAWIPGQIALPPQFTGRSLTSEQVDEILKAFEKPYWGQVTELSNKYGVPVATISHIKRGRLKYSIPDTQ